MQSSVFWACLISRAARSAPASRRRASPHKTKVHQTKVHYPADLSGANVGHDRYVLP